MLQQAVAINRSAITRYLDEFVTYYDNKGDVPAEHISHSFAQRGLDEGDAILLEDAGRPRQSHIENFLLAVTLPWRVTCLR